jgi:glycosyltransferase involved in cell wall biosynthesis
MKILNFPSQPHFFSFGGFDIQMNRVIENINDSEISSIKVDLWSRNIDFDIAHFWGASNSHKLNIEFCKRNGKAVVVSPLFPPNTLFNNIKYWAKIQLSKTLGYKHSILLADYLFVINESQAAFAKRYLSISNDRIFVIPTMLDEAFYSDTSLQEDIRENLFDGFSLCVGTICKRKNQINLIKAAIIAQIPVVFVGRLESSEDTYCNEFISLVEKYPHLVRHFEGVSADELTSLYKKCALVSCISYSETEPASILEGMIFSKPILVSKKPFSNNSTFLGVVKVDPSNFHDIAEQLLKLSKVNFIDYQKFDALSYRPSNVYERYKNIYKLISKK